MLFGGVGETNLSTTPHVAETQLKSEALGQVTTTIRHTTTVESTVRKFFAQTPILAEVAMCESTFKQFNADGSVLRGKANAADVGVMQINEKYHAKRALDLEIDIYSLEGNLEYGKLLYTEQGTKPWNASSPCWSKQVASN